MVRLKALSLTSRCSNLLRLTSWGLFFHPTKMSSWSRQDPPSAACVLASPGQLSPWWLELGGRCGLACSFWLVVPLLRAPDLSCAQLVESGQLSLLAALRPVNYFSSSLMGYLQRCARRDSCCELVLWGATSTITGQHRCRSRVWWRWFWVVGSPSPPSGNGGRSKAQPFPSCACSARRSRCCGFGTWTPSSCSHSQMNPPNNFSSLFSSGLLARFTWRLPLWMALALRCPVFSS